jgi:amino acid transporter
MSILGTNGNQVLAGPRYVFALARDGFGPALLARIHPRFHTPAAAILMQSAVALPLALTGSFARLASTSMLALIATYVGTAAAVPVLRRKFAGEPAGFRLPGGPVIPLAAGLLCLALAWSATRADVIAGAAAVVVGFALYLFRRPPMLESPTTGQEAA